MIVLVDPVLQENYLVESEENLSIWYFISISDQSKLEWGIDFLRSPHFSYLEPVKTWVGYRLFAVPSFFQPWTSQNLRGVSIFCCSLIFPTLNQSKLEWGIDFLLHPHFSNLESANLLILYLFYILIKSTKFKFLNWSTENLITWNISQILRLFKFWRESDILINFYVKFSV